MKMFSIASISENLFLGKFDDYNFTMVKLYDFESQYPYYTVGYCNIVLQPDDNGNYGLFLLTKDGDMYLYKQTVTSKLGENVPQFLGPEFNRGTWLIRLVLNLMKYLNMRSLGLNDISTVKVGPYDVHLRLIRLLMGKSSWYSQYGFVDDDDQIKDITEKLYNYPINCSTFGIIMKNLYERSPLDFAESLQDLYDQDENIKFYIDYISEVKMILRLT